MTGAKAPVVTFGKNEVKKVSRLSDFWLEMINISTKHKKTLSGAGNCSQGYAEWQFKERRKDE